MHVSLYAWAAAKDACWRAPLLICLYCAHACALATLFDVVVLVHFKGKSPDENSSEQRRTGEGVIARRGWGLSADWHSWREAGVLLKKKLGFN